MRKRIIKLVLNKIFQFLLVMFLLSLIVFYMARLSPGDPLKSYYGESVERMSIAQQEAAMERLGLDEPIYLQYTKWIENAAAGDFGISFKYKQDVMKVIGDVYENTLILGGLAYILNFGLALLLGVFCALHEEEWIDRIICKIGVVTNCIPAFFISLVFILIFGVNLAILPTSGAYSIGQSQNIMDRLVHLILPLAVLVLGHLWYYTYMVRNKLLEETRQDYVLLCKVKGLSKRQIMWKHCLKNIMPSFISIMAISIPHILGGTYVVEKVFSYPGLGTLSFESAQFHDYNMLLVLCLITGAVVVTANITAQIINEIIDPRMKYERGDLQ
ncbi:ABC transporter permease [Anaerovorax odorimutans]|uniref:ABC transporter permease n=1 Tax=Anaerovorax odorimutans TaxID=109327 RepID=UPI00040507D5|nr:ABC transporter permease [Anaerovorax odorimutans]